MQTEQSKRGIAAWMLVGAIAGSIPMIAPQPAAAQQRAGEPGEMADVEASKVPPAVAAAVRTEAPDGRDVVYSKASGKDEHYRVGVTIPSGIRLRLAIRGDGTPLKAPELAENQPKDAPKGKDVRERLLAEYQQRAVAARAAAASPPVAARPPVPPQPPVPGQPPVPPQPPVAAPAPVPPVAGQPPAVPPAPPAPLPPVAGQPAVPAAVPTLPGNPPEVNGVRAAVIPWRDVPDAAKATLQPLAGKDKNAVYTKQIREGNHVYYGATYTDGGKEMWVRVNEAGKTVAGPVLAEAGKASDDDARPAASKVPGGTAGAAAGTVKLTELPKSVQQTITQHTMGGKNVQATKITDDGKPAYRVTWADATGDKHEMRVDADGKQIVEKPAQKAPAKK